MYYLTEVFEEELADIFDEDQLMPIDKAISLAKDRAIERISGYICRIADQRKWKHKEDVNRNFYESSVLKWGLP